MSGLVQYAGQPSNSRMRMSNESNSYAFTAYSPGLGP